jgi:hypothetical protein
MESDEPICHFVGIIPPIQGAVKFSGEGDARVLFEAPASEMAEVMKLIGYGRDKALRVKVYADET